MGHRVRRLDLFVTEACNLACPYCFATTGARRHLGQEHGRQAVDWLLSGAQQRVHITFWGGEPLLRRGTLRALVAYARDAARSRGKALTMALPTNGTLLDEETVAWLFDEEVTIFVSIDGDEEAQQERPLAAGGSSHRAAVEGLQRALSAARMRGRKLPAARVTVTARNAARLRSSVAFLQQVGTREALVYPAFDGRWTQSEIEAFAAGQRGLARWLVGQIERDPASAIRIKPWVGLLRLLGGEHAERDSDDALAACGLGDELIALSVDGRFSPCHRLVTYDAAGALDLGRLEGLEPARLEAKRMAERESTDGLRCVDCAHFSLCSFNCPAVSYATTGTLDRVPGHVCDLMAAQADACREVARALEGDPRLSLYLEGSLAGELQRAVRALGARTVEHYRRLQQQGMLVERAGGDDGAEDHR